MSYAALGRKYTKIVKYCNVVFGKWKRTKTNQQQNDNWNSSDEAENIFYKPLKKLTNEIWRNI